MKKGTLLLLTLFGCGAGELPITLELPGVLRQNLGAFNSLSATVTVTSTDTTAPVDGPGSGDADSGGGSVSTPTPVFTSEPLVAGEGPITLAVTLEPGDYTAACRYRDTRTSGTTLDLLEVSTAEFTVFPGREATAEASTGGRIDFDADEDSFNNLDEIIRWESDPEASAVEWSLALEGDGASDVFDLGNGSLLIVEAELGRPAERGLLVVDAATGEEVWTNANASWPLLDLANGAVVAFVSSISGARVAALDIDDGSVVWQTSVISELDLAGGGIDLGLTPLANGSFVFGARSELYVISNDGASITSYGAPTSPNPMTRCPLVGALIDNRTVSGNVLYAFAKGECFDIPEQNIGMGALVAVDFSSTPTASIIATADGLGVMEPNPGASCLTLANDTLYWSTGYTLTSLDTSGGERWSVALASPQAGEQETCEGARAPIVAAGTVYVGTNINGIAAIQDSDGSVLWTRSSFGSEGPYGSGFSDPAPGRDAPRITLVASARLLTTGAPDSLGVLSTRPLVLNAAAEGALAGIGANGLSAQAGVQYGLGRMAGDLDTIYLVVPDRSGTVTNSLLIATHYDFSESEL